MGGSTYWDIPSGRPGHVSTNVLYPTAAGVSTASDGGLIIGTHTKTVYPTNSYGAPIGASATGSGIRVPGISTVVPTMASTQKAHGAHTFSASANQAQSTSGRGGGKKGSGSSTASPKGSKPSAAATPSDCRPTFQPLLGANGKPTFHNGQPLYVPKVPKGCAQPTGVVSPHSGKGGSSGSTSSSGASSSGSFGSGSGSSSDPSAQGSGHGHGHGHGQGSEGQGQCATPPVGTCTCALPGGYVLKTTLELPSGQQAAAVSA